MPMSSAEIRHTRLFDRPLQCWLELRLFAYLRPHFGYAGLGLCCVNFGKARIAILKATEDAAIEAWLEPA